MFRCERCGSRYSAMHAATIENCPRCQIRDHAASPLVFAPFRLSPADRGDQPGVERSRRDDALGQEEQRSGVGI